MRGGRPSHGGQYPTIHYQEQPLDGNLNLFPWNSSIKRDLRRAGAPRVGCIMCTVLEQASLLDLRVWRQGCKKIGGGGRLCQHSPLGYTPCPQTSMGA